MSKKSSKNDRQILSRNAHLQATTGSFITHILKINIIEKFDEKVKRFVKKIVKKVVKKLSKKLSEKLSKNAHL